MESRKTEGGEINFGGTRWYVYFVDIDALTLLSVHWRRSRGVGGLSCYPEISLQHTSSFCKTFSVLIRRYVCINLSSQQNVGNIVVITKNTCYFTLHRVWNIDLHNAKNSISGPLDFNIFLRRSYSINPLEHPSKNLSYGPDTDFKLNELFD